MLKKSKLREAEVKISYSVKKHLQSKSQYFKGKASRHPAQWFHSRSLGGADETSKWEGKKSPKPGKGRIAMGRMTQAPRGEGGEKEEWAALKAQGRVCGPGLRGPPFTEPRRCVSLPAALPGQEGCCRAAATPLLLGGLPGPYMACHYSLQLSPR